MLSNLGSAELLIVGIVILVIFGSKKLNDLARGLGESTKEMKNVKREYNDAVKGVYEDNPPKKKPTDKKPSPEKESVHKETKPKRFKIGGD